MPNLRTAQKRAQVRESTPVDKDPVKNASRDTKDTNVLPGKPDEAAVLGLDTVEMPVTIPPGPPSPRR